MNPKSFFAALVLLFIASRSFAQDSTFITNRVRKHLDIPDRGWTGIVTLRDGKTVLLYLANKERMIIKIFDKDHNEIASTKQLFKIIGEKDLGESKVRGFFDIMGIPTLFLEQDI